MTIDSFAQSIAILSLLQSQLSPASTEKAFRSYMLRSERLSENRDIVTLEANWIDKDKRAEEKSAQKRMASLIFDVEFDVFAEIHHSVITERINQEIHKHLQELPRFKFGDIETIINMDEVRRPSEKLVFRRMDKAVFDNLSICEENFIQLCALANGGYDDASFSQLKIRSDAPPFVFTMWDAYSVYGAILATAYEAAGLAKGKNTADLLIKKLEDNIETTFRNPCNLPSAGR